MPRRTFQPHNLSTKRSQGFRARMAIKLGAVLKRRRQKGRKELV